MNFFVWEHVKNNIYSINRTSLEEFQAWITDATKGITEKKCCRIVLHFVCEMMADMLKINNPNNKFKVF